MRIRVILRRTYIGAIVVAVIVREGIALLFRGIADPLADGAGWLVNFLMERALRDATPWMRFSWSPYVALPSAVGGIIGLVIAFLVARWLYPTEQRPEATLAS